MGGWTDLRNPTIHPIVLKVEESMEDCRTLEKTHA
jgi:hypothetical protein